MQRAPLLGSSDTSDSFLPLLEEGIEVDMPETVCVHLLPVLSPGRSQASAIVTHPTTIFACAFSNQHGSYLEADWQYLPQSFHCCKNH
jgi:hypothetical protein